MLSVVIPTLNAERTLPRALSALVSGAVSGLVREVIVSDGGSTDLTSAIAEESGAQFIASMRGRGAQLRTGAARARGPWLLFLHADTVLDASWTEDAERFMDRAERIGAEHAAVFTFALDGLSSYARMLERTVKWRCSVLALPYGDQGLLISKRFYERLGGYGDLPLMEDVDLVRRIGRRRLSVLKSAAVTSAARYEQGGYVGRPLRNLLVLSLYFAGVPPRLLTRLYG